jgi:hypothetical protein
VNENGSKVWYIPDAFLPEAVQSAGPYTGHEAICVLNVSSSDATLHLDLFFEDRPPAKDIEVVVPAERTRHIRMDDPAQLGGFEVPVSIGYAVRVRSDVPVIVQYTRVDTTQTQCALLSTMAIPWSEA